MAATLPPDVLVNVTLGDGGTVLETTLSTVEAIVQNVTTPMVLSIDPVKGDSGLPGPPGATGPTGPQGPQGIPGVSSLATTSANGLLRQISGNTTDFVDGTNNCQPLQPVIWSATRRVFNAIGNPNGEVSQRNVGNALANPANLAFIEDRWMANTNLAGTNYVRITPTAPALLPGTSFPISNGLLRFTVATPKPTLAAGDVVGWTQNVEGSALRELISDVHSVSILIRSTVSPLHFGVWVRTPGTPFYALNKLCTYTASPLVFQLIQLPNLPIWPSGGTFPITPGQAGYSFGVCFAAGSSLITPANDTWQSGNFLGAVGQDNFMANAANSYVEIAFIQHEPGAQCSTLIDKPFAGNYDECLRYYCKSYGYAVRPGTADLNGSASTYIPAYNHPVFYIPFPRAMAKIPTITAYSPNSGAINNIYDATTPVDRSISQSYYSGEKGFDSFLVNAAPAVLWNPMIHYTADTGW